MAGNDTLETPLPRQSTFGALFSRTLPAYSGLYPVGVRDVELPIPPQTFGTFKHRSMPNGQVGITLDTVMFTLFYPTEPTTAKAPAIWFPRLVQTVNGLLKMAHWSNLVCKIIVYAIVTVITWGTTFPGVKDAPLRVPPKSAPWRLILFSHGAGCSRLMNSAICGELASRGYVVAAIEHCDGTGPSVRITNERGETRDLYWLDWIDLEWTHLEEQPTDDMMLRRVQLDVRLAEVDGVLRALRQRTQGQDSSLEDWHMVDVTKPIIAGHSFGGCLAIAAATDQHFGFSHVITFDPAVHRLGPRDKTISMPFLAINSEEFTTWKEFNQLLNMTSSTEMHEIYVMTGTKHSSFSDVFLVLPDHINRWFGLVVDPWHLICRTVDATHRFLDDEETNAHHSIKCVDGMFLKDNGIGIGRLVRCRVDALDCASDVPP